MNTNIGVAPAAGQSGWTSSGFMMAPILDVIGALVVALDTEGRIVLFNRACETLTGYSFEEVRDQPFFDLFLPPEEVEQVRAVFAALVAGDYPNSHTNRWCTRSGETRLITWTNTAIIGSGGAVDYVIGTGIDMSQRTAAEQKVQDLRDQLLRVTRLSELGQMVSALAHEVNQPLAAVMNYVQAGRRLLQTRPDETREHVLALMDKAVGQVERASAIIRGLRNFAAKSNTRRHPEEIDAVVEEASRLALIGASALGVRSTLRLEAGPLLVVMDKVQVQQVILNLIRNAVEAMAEVRRRDLVIESVCVGDMVEVAVHDSGPGFANSVTERLFEPFVTTKPDGIGIGLPLSQTIIDAHGGRLRVERNALGGATLRFTLPLATPRPEPEPAPEGG
ncbi:MAG: PAS domain S-box protein [Rhodospirillales bacterium]|nr:PAS domain S-box protein [Rhodospirillales bacterium]